MLPGWLKKVAERWNPQNPFNVQKTPKQPNLQKWPKSNPSACSNRRVYFWKSGFSTQCNSRTWPCTARVWSVVVAWEVYIDYCVLWLFLAFYPILGFCSCFGASEWIPFGLCQTWMKCFLHGQKQPRARQHKAVIYGPCFQSHPSHGAPPKGSHPSGNNTAASNMFEDIWRLINRVELLPNGPTLHKAMALLLSRKFQKV